MKNDDSFIYDYDEIIGVSIPSTIEEAINILLNRLSKKEISEIKNNNIHYYDCHIFLGRQIRNDWNLWDVNTPIVKYIIFNYGLSHPDDCSGLIIAGLFAKIRNKDVGAELSKLSKFYREHWVVQGFDPSSLKPLDKRKKIKVK